MQINFKHSLCTAALCSAFTFSASAQTQFDTGQTVQSGEKPSVEIKQAARMGRSPALSELLRIDAEKAATGKKPVVKPGAINTHQIPPRLTINAALDNNLSGSGTVQDPAAVSDLRAPAVQLSIEGYSNDDNAALIGGRITPPDTNGDVGLNHYVQYINLGWVFFDKATGAVAGGPFAGNLFWQGFGGVCETQNAGDPIVLYDHLAGRWLFSQFTGTSISDGHQCVAISDGENPAGPYTLYDFVVSPNAFNDYPKIGLWNDGYYMTTHEFAGPQLSFAGVNLNVFDRTAMLAGDPNAGFIQFSSVDSGDELEFGTIAGNLEGPSLPPAGTCNYLVHASDVEAFGLPGSDRYRLWEACVDFSNPAASSLNQINSIGVPAFDKNLCGFSRDCIQQPGPQNLDALAAMTIYRFNLRYFGNEGVLKGVATTNVDVGADRAGVLWAGIDINPTNNATALSDGGNLRGVIDFNDGENRWMGSATLDQDGNVGIGYTRSSNSTFPSIYFTVHERGVDAPGAVQQESLCVAGSGSHEGANRWADYASASIDPVDQCTFWITNEYVETTGNFSWNTRVCSFRIPSCGGGGGNIPPTASFTFGCNNLTCNFDASGSSDSDGSITGYSWSFGDGASGSGVTTSHTYATGGTFNVSLTVTDDGGASDSTSQSVTVTSPPTGNCPAGSIDFNSFATTSFSNQDNTGSGSVTVEDGGDTLALIGNRWRASTQTFSVTPNTVIEFDFAGGPQGEIHGIGFDEDDTISQNRIFRFWGTQNWGTTFNPQYSGSGAFQSYRVPVGQSYTGGSMRLVFVNDKDANPQDAQSRFRCVRVFEDTPSGGNCALEQNFGSDATGWINGASATCTTGDFIRGAPTAVSNGGVTTQPAGDNAGGGSALFTAANSSAGVDDVDGGTCVLESPTITVADASTLNMAYFHGQRDAGDDAGDFFALEVSTNGGASYSSVVSQGDITSNAIWTNAPATSIPAGSQVKIRLRVADGPGPGDLVEAGLDDVSICPN
ncbi:MAG: hypothetical protein Tsb002_24810 [Wenzhouxiangellaceae bacterium]